MVKDWEQSRACKIMNNLDPNVWIWASEMNEKEKEDNPKYETTDGYLKTIPYKEAWANLWGNLSDDDKNVFTSLPNFSSEIFEDITGIKVKKPRRGK